ncbi:DUF6461 domain-containing protein [Streptomyces sp. NPDC005283]|uniref:DUF6461 domain-containing protein n=1 Tax=Streptomyces sp. NPDC005283 TaxID=3156871 RepID=UPI003451CF09
MDAGGVQPGGVGGNRVHAEGRVVHSGRFAGPGRWVEPFLRARPGRCQWRLRCSDHDRDDGSDPDGLLDTMRKVGFDLSEGGGRDYALHTEATFVPAERITGLLLTPELLRTSEFVCGTVPIPDH